nr:fimbrillin family protein [Alistipes onderdonkii]
MKTTLLTALAAAALAAGCSKSDTGTPCVKIAPTIQTRVTGLHFDTGDRIGLSIAKGSETYVQNVLMTYDGTAFTAPDLLWYNDSNEKSTLTAYHPYSGQGMPAEFSVALDQTSGAASSDLLVAVKKDVTPTSAPVGMLFYHVMSQLTIVITNNSDASVAGVTVGGLVPTAVVDYTVPSAAAKGGVAASDVEAFEVTTGAAYRVILVPQQAALTVTVATDDGKSRSKTLSSAQLESGKRYDMSVVVTNIDIDVELSGEVVDWGDGGSLDGGEGGDEGGGEGGDPGTLSYGGVDYPIATIGGRVWMTRNLRYLPDGAQVGTGIWYPCRGSEGSNDAEYVAERGLLYSFTTALGGTTAASGTPVRGICPPGWHVPTGAEIEQMIASPEYDASLLRSAGMWNSDAGLYVAEKKGYLMSCTSEDNGAMYKALLYSSDGIVAGLAPFPAGNGVSLRCVKDS